MEQEHTTTHHHVFDTAIGPCGVAWTARGLVGVRFAETSADATEQRLAAKFQRTPAADPAAWVAALIADIRRYLAGERVDFSTVPVDLSSLDDFRRKLYETMRALAWGKTTTYGALARDVGLEGWE